MEQITETLLEEHKSVDYVKVITLQLIYMATGTIVVSGTFLKDIFKHPLGWSVFVLIGSWGLLFFSVLFGLWVLGSIARGYIKDGKADISQNPIKRNGLIQAWTFRIGILAFIVFLSFNILIASYPSKQEDLKQIHSLETNTMKIKTAGSIEISIHDGGDVRIKINAKVK